MNSAICTLFEGNYHYGLGALTNSLYHQGFRGVVWAGYRGQLPPWAQPLKNHDAYQEYAVGDGLSIRFIFLETDYHFTNYKPDLMLTLWKEFCQEAETIFYFDPDITIKCRWSYFEEWASYGIALCEDINSPILETHPLRLAWQKYYRPFGYGLQNITSRYVNGGFVGITKDRITFLKDWKEIQELMVAEIGSLAYANASKNSDTARDRTFPFYKTDQDALNIAVMNTEHPLSLIGKEGMDFQYGGFTMSHALGSPKPWNKSIALMALKGKPPSLADNEYWKYTKSPINLYSKNMLLRKHLDLKIGKILGRIL
jgi:hypothetical protein